MPTDKQLRSAQPKSPAPARGWGLFLPPLSKGRARKSRALTT